MNSMKFSFNLKFIVMLTILAGNSNAFASVMFTQDFIKDAVGGGGLKQAVEIYVNSFRQKAQAESLLAALTPVVARELLGTDESLRALNHDIEGSEYIADADRSKCDSLIVNGRFVERIQAKTAFRKDDSAPINGSPICFNIAAIAKAYSKMTAEEGLRILVSFALHEHYHHFQSDPGDSDALRMQAEKAAYDLQAFVVSTDTSGVPGILQYAKSSEPLRLEDLPPEIRDNPMRRLLIGDHVVLTERRCSLYPGQAEEVGNWNGLDSTDLICQPNWYADTLVNKPIPEGILTVVATNGDMVAVTGTLNGKPYFGFSKDQELGRPFGCSPFSRNYCVGHTYIDYNTFTLEDFAQLAKIEYRVIAISPSLIGSNVIKVVRAQGYGNSGHDSLSNKFTDISNRLGYSVTEGMMSVKFAREVR